MSYNTISKMFYSVAKNANDKKILFYKDQNSWSSLTGKDVISIVKKISFSLHSNDICPQDRVAIISNTSYKWALCDYGIISMGAVTTTVYPSLLPNQIEYILQDSKSKLIFVEDELQLEKIKSIKDNCPSLKKIIVMNNSYDGEEKFVQNLNSFLIVDPEYVKVAELDFNKMINIAKPNDLLTLIYTSGTTGTPKGVMLTHENLIANIVAVEKVQPNIKNETFLSFLPLSHVLERMGGHFFAFYLNSKIYYAENMETVAKNMEEVSPSVVVCVPRFFEKMYNAVIKGVREGSPIKKKLFWWAINIGKDYVASKHANNKISLYLKFRHKVADKLIYSKIKSKIGGNIKFFISGGAPLSRDVAEFFASLNVTILEGYGLTETSPVLTSNTPANIRFGTVGKPLDNVELKIANDGEILAKGPNIMAGYYNNKEATDEVIDSDGWFHTGDIGEFDKDGFLKITDRKKSLIVTSGGKNIAPAPLENALLGSEYIEQVLVLGDKRNFLSALIVPLFDNVEKYLSDNGNDVSGKEAIIEYPDVIELFEKEVSKAMSEFSKFEQIKKFALLSRQFMIEKGEMTPKMSIVRKTVENNFKDKIDELYKGANE